MLAYGLLLEEGSHGRAGVYRRPLGDVGRRPDRLPSLLERAGSEGTTFVVALPIRAEGPVDAAR
jgi:hypothetical protein